MIGISLNVYDVIGAKIFKDADKKDLLNESGSRRCTRTATLDGGCDIYDTGYFISDKTIVIQQENASKEFIDYTKYITENYETVIVSTKDGVFLGNPESYRVQDRNGILEFRILLKEKISE